MSRKCLGMKVNIDQDHVSIRNLARQKNKIKQSMQAAQQ
jgi:hypothetical protein